METKFTEGEWVCCDDDGETWIDNANAGLIADLYSSDVSYIESLANAHLMAAAPDMYAKLSELESFMEQMHEADIAWTIKESRLFHKELRSLLAKARGE